jgi:hypothetical protein
VAFVAEELFDETLPVYSLEEDDFGGLQSGLKVRIHSSGRIEPI